MFAPMVHQDSRQLFNRLRLVDIKVKNVAERVAERVVRKRLHMLHEIDQL